MRSAFVEVGQVVLWLLFVPFGALFASRRAARDRASSCEATRTDSNN